METRPAQLPSGEPIRILVAEDTEDNRLLLEHYLRDEPVKLRIALNGQEAVDAVQQGEQFDLILMDIDMPVMDGYTATRHIRAWQQSQGLLDASRPSHTHRGLVGGRHARSRSRQHGCRVRGACRQTDGPRNAAENHPALCPSQRSADCPDRARTIAVSEQVKALVPQYLASKEKQIEDARASLASRDFGPIRRFGHNLKGTGRGYGFPPIEELGREIERAASEADASRITEQLDALHRFVIESH